MNKSRPTYRVYCDDGYYDRQVQTLLRSKKAVVIYTPTFGEKLKKNIAKLIYYIRTHANEIKKHTNVKTILAIALCSFMIISTPS